MFSYKESNKLHIFSHNQYLFPFKGQCQVPAIQNATLIGAREQVYVNHNAEVEFQCNGGLVPRGESRMRCYNGTWSSVVECVPGDYNLLAW